MEGIGIIGIDHIGFCVRELGPYGNFLNKMGFRSRGPNLFRSGRCDIRLMRPASGDCLEGQYLGQHPDGVGLVAFNVTDVQRTAALLEGRDATFMSDVVETESERWIDITTPIGDVVFRFIERRDQVVRIPGPYHGFDHFTCHFNTMAPVIWWLKAVMGFERYWDFQFHTRDDCEGMKAKTGTGMRSLVMRCPQTGITFALNEPLRPDFRNSQVWRFVRDNRGAGIQHIALNVPDVCRAVDALGSSNFLGTPGCYYDHLGERLQTCGVRGIDECPQRLRSLGVLVDAEGPGEYLLQIFMRSMGELLGDPRCGPFFFELIQRKGARGFGSGNFKALFEAVERNSALVTASH